ncbi:MAG TPA: hypothetical protein VFT16_00805 [Candidatus Saccharimonadales bacterium]|nr:hypothetical protein [Candidatus Saccharimonadales bacterium]
MKKYPIQRVAIYILFMATVNLIILDTTLFKTVLLALAFGVTMGFADLYFDRKYLSRTAGNPKK